MKKLGGLLTVCILALSSFAQSTNRNYEVVSFGVPPEGDEWGDTISVAADGRGSILVLRRVEPPVLVFDREGELQDSWGEGLFPNNHSIDVDHEGFVWITDRTNNLVHKFTIDGQELLSLGTRGVTGDSASTSAFDGPADVAVAPNGEIFVLDGNSRIVHFSERGSFIKILGGVSGTGTGEFDGAHAIALDSRGRVLVVDRQGEARNPRIQIFDQEGQFVEEWSNLAGLIWPSDIAIGEDDTVFISESDGANITVVRDGKVIEWIAGLEARPHNISRDEETGALYLADSTEPGAIKKVVRK
jgi:DNA-binding beta-propeller fold protein YncE